MEVVQDRKADRLNQTHTSNRAGGDMMNVSQVSKTSVKDLKNLTDGIVGLHNNRYYCYMNAIIQCFAPMIELRNYYLT
jgi:ubiquitin C-terminal hydrolase